MYAFYDVAYLLFDTTAVPLHYQSFVSLMVQFISLPSGHVPNPSEQAGPTQHVYTYT